MIHASILRGVMESGGVQAMTSLVSKWNIVVATMKKVGVNNGRNN